MAESVVTFLVERLGTLAEEEIRLLCGVAQEINDIKEEFQSIKILLRSADAKVDLDEGVKEWVKQVRRVAYEIEDVLDQYFLTRRRIGSINNIFGKIRGFFKCLESHHEIGNQIIDIKKDIKNICSRKERYDLGNLEGASSSTTATFYKHDPRQNALFLEESDLVGIDGPREKLTGYICEANPKLVVVSILGEGGLGKTTIVKKVFDSPQVKDAFLYRAWLTISQTPDAKALLAYLLKHLFPELPEEDNIVKVKQQLNDNLRGKRYVVVLDDVWTTSDWESFRNALPNDNESASRILVTTRNQEVAACIQDCGHIYPLERLNSDQSWKLFYMKICRSRIEDMSCYSEDFLRAQLEKFLRKCNGLPIAIVAIGGLLSMKRPSEWDQVYQTLGSLMDQPSGSLGVLHMVISLSFNDLRYPLKSCFLYLCMFPEDYTINCSRLLRLWVAQGFVETKQRNDKTIEEIARDYLNELIQRSLIQAEYINSCKKVVKCKIHDLMRDFIIGKARDQSFAEVVAWKQDDNSVGQLQQSRHLSIYKFDDDDDDDDDAKNNTIFDKKNRLVVHYRSLFIFSLKYADFATNMFLRFKLLKVLDLEDVRLNEFPDGVVNLFYLKYLSLRGSRRLSSLPISVGKLVQLETLDLRGTDIMELPVTILKLKHLRNLLLRYYGAKLPIGFGCLVSLEKVAVVDGSESLLKELGMLTRLRCLEVCALREDDGKQLFASIERMKYLRTFKVRTPYMSSMLIDSHSLSSPPPYLRCLFMDGILNKLPAWFSLLEKLEKLRLDGCGLRNDHFRVLQALPNLMTLRLWSSAFHGEELCINKYGFPRLNELELVNMSFLNNVKVEEGAMPVIQSIEFWTCNKLQNIPYGIHHLVTLKTITYRDMPNSFVVQLKDHQILLRENGVSLTVVESVEGR